MFHHLVCKLIQRVDRMRRSGMLYKHIEYQHCMPVGEESEEESKGQVFTLDNSDYFF
jgi:hypothetical protein